MPVHRDGVHNVAEHISDGDKSEKKAPYKGPQKHTIPNPKPNTNSHRVAARIEYTGTDCRSPKSATDVTRRDKAADMLVRASSVSSKMARLLGTHISGTWTKTLEGTGKIGIQKSRYPSMPSARKIRTSVARPRTP